MHIVKAGVNTGKTETTEEKNKFTLSSEGKVMRVKGNSGYGEERKRANLAIIGIAEN